MTDRSAKPTMMRFEPESGWSAAAAPLVPIQELSDQSNPPSRPAASLTTDALLNLGESMQDVYENLKISESQLQGWNQVHAALRLLGAKLQERKSILERLAALDEEIEDMRQLAMEVVNNAHQSEHEVHEISRLRLQIAESLSEKLGGVLKG